MLQPLGRIAACDQFFVYQLSEWDGTKYRRKKPWANGHPVSPSAPSSWSSYTAALARAQSYPTTGDVTYCVGLWITASLGIFFLDIDRLPADYTLDDTASSLVAQFPGCMMEWSSSRRGLHILGSLTGPAGPHGNRADPLELYTDGRGIALASTAQGSIDTDATAAFHALVAARFPRTTSGGVVLPVVPAAPGVLDVAAQSQLYRQCDKIRAARDGERNAVLNTAAFTLGGMVGAGRLTRAAVEEGLLQATIDAGWDDVVLQRAKIRQGLDSGAAEPLMPVVRVDVATAAVGADTGVNWHTAIDKLISDINNTGKYEELTDVVIPTIGPMNIPDLHTERVVQALRKRLEIFDSKPPIAKIRQLVRPPVAADAIIHRPPAWFAPFCYVRRTETFYNTLTGSHFTADNFRVEFSRYMPYKLNNEREDPLKAARDKWSVVTVEDTLYRPDCDVFFEYGQHEYANEFLPSSLPTVTQPSPECIAAIQAFQQHLFLICGHREALYYQLLWWIAHNVQKPGRKIRWTPIIKGVPGDGKSIVSDVMRAALGISNVKMTSISSLANSGGFTDWASGAAVNFIEEIQLTGKERYKLFNAMKTYIADNFIDINRKGRASGMSVTNVTNHWANTNYGDALPLDDGDRRWCVVFTPYTTIEEAAAAKGLADVDALVAHFKMLGTSMRAEPGAWRGWLLGIDTSAFVPDGRAPDTGEKSSMKLMSQDPMDQSVIDVLEQGGQGITKECFSSSVLMTTVAIRTGEKVSNRHWNMTLSRLGYLQMEKTVWWNNQTHRIWAKKSLTKDEIKTILDKTLVSCQKF